MSQPPCEESELVRDVFAAVFLGSPKKPVWEFADESVFLSEQQSAETAISMVVREQAMNTLSQRYEHVPHTIGNSDIDALPALVRATLVFDDNHSKLLNWIGKVEKIKPTMRIGRVALSKGSRSDDLRMELVLEIPLRREEPGEKL